MKRTIDEHAARVGERAERDDEDCDPVSQACRDRVIAATEVAETYVVLDLGTGTGAIALALAPAADRVVGRDISEGMLADAYAPGRVVLGDVRLFAEPDPSDPFFDPEVDDQATGGWLVEWVTDAGFAVTMVTAVHPQVGVIVAEPR